MADCAACGLPLTPEARFCRHCGAGVTEAALLRGYATGAAPTPDPSLPAGGPTPSRPAVTAPNQSASPSQPARSNQPAGSSQPARSAESRPAVTPPDRPTLGWAARSLIAAVVVLAVVAGVGLALVGTRRAAGPQLVSGSAAPVGGALGTTAPGTPSPSASPGRVTVQLAPSQQGAPHAAAVVALFRQYFQAINDRDYDSWVATMSGDHAPNPRATFLEDYSTTVDDDIRILSITQQEDGSLLAAVSFRSRQDPKYAPVDQPADCLHWQITYPLAVQDGRLTISPVDRAPRMYRRCTDNLVSRTAPSGGG